jgi:tetratricopeptide (TPR) repeat protein
MADAPPDADAGAAPEEPQIPALTFEVHVAEGKNLRQLLAAAPPPAPVEGEEDAADPAPEQIAVQVVAPPGSEGGTSAPVGFDGEDCAFSFTASFEKAPEDSLFNFLCINPLELKLLSGVGAGEEEDTAEPAVLGSLRVGFDALLDGELEYTSWYHVSPVAAVEGAVAELEAHPEVRVTIKVSEPMQTRVAAQECTVLSLGVDKAFSLPQSFAFPEEVSEEPSPADAFRFGLKLSIPVTGEEDFDLVSLAGAITAEPVEAATPAVGEGEAGTSETELEAEAGPEEGEAAEGGEGDESTAVAAVAAVPSITWDMSECAYLTAEACERVKALVESGQGLAVRIWRNTVGADGAIEDCEPNWSNVAESLESGEVNEYVGEAILGCTELLSSGATVVEAQVPVTALPVPEPTEEPEEAKAKGKGKGKATPDPAEDGEKENPFVAAGTYISVRIQLTRPIVPELPAPPPLPKPSEIVPPRPRVPRVVAPASGTDEFKTEVDTLLESLLDEYASLNVSNGSSATEVRQQFLFELNSSGKYFAFKEKLKKSVVRIVKERFHKTPTGRQAEVETLVNQLYVYLVQQMHVCLNDRFSSAKLGSDAADMDAAASSLPVDKLYSFAREAEANQQYDLARSYMQDIVCADDSNIDGWTAFARFCFRMHDVPKGCECLREAVSIDATHVPTLQSYAAVQLSLGDLEASQAFLHGAAELDSTNAMTWVLLGLLYSMLERPIDAKSCNLEAKRLGLPAEFESPHMAAWRFCLDLHLTSVAELAITEQEKVTGSSFATFVAMGEAMLQKDDHAAAEQVLKEALTLEGESFEAWTLLGRCHCAQSPDHGDDAVSALEAAVGADAPSVAARCGVLLRLGELSVARESFARAQEVRLMPSVFVFVLHPPEVMMG